MANRTWEFKLFLPRYSYAVEVGRARRGYITKLMPLEGVAHVIVCDPKVDDLQRAGRNRNTSTFTLAISRHTNRRQADKPLPCLAANVEMRWLYSTESMLDCLGRKGGRKRNMSSGPGLRRMPSRAATAWKKVVPRQLN